MSWVITCYDCNQDQRFVVGPFPHVFAAFAWAARDAEEKAAQWDMKDGIDFSPDESIVIMDGNHENVYEWNIVKMVNP
jgi:hypothetical protein